jgi:hypothetical protein
MKPNLRRRLSSPLFWICLVAIGSATLIAAIDLQNTAGQRRLGGLVGIRTYLPISDAELDQAAKREYPIGMSEEEALQKLKERGLDAWPQSEVKRWSSEKYPSSEFLVIMPSNQQITLVMKEHLLVLEFDTDSLRIKHSEVSYGLTGF